MTRKRKTTRLADFKRWLKNRRDMEFGCGGEDCPLHDWLGRDMHNGDLDELPPWCSRFVGYWDATWAPDSCQTGRKALSVLDELF